MTARFKGLALIRSNIIDAGQGRSTLRLCTRRLDMMRNPLFGSSLEYHVKNAAPQ